MRNFVALTVYVFFRVQLDGLDRRLFC